MTWTLLALLPLTAVVGTLGGRAVFRRALIPLQALERRPRPRRRSRGRAWHWAWEPGIVSSPPWSAPSMGCSAAWQKRWSASGGSRKRHRTSCERR